jgi:hypothetical protein
VSDTSVDAAVEKIISDSTFAQQVLTNPDQTLKAHFDLAPDEVMAISSALQSDVTNSLGEVLGYTNIDFSAVQFTLLPQLASLKGSFPATVRIPPTVTD